MTLILKQKFQRAVILKTIEDKNISISNPQKQVMKLYYLMIKTVKI